MAEVITTVMSAIATNASRLPDLTIKNGQLIFVKDKHFIALDIGNKRNFFNQITILQTENERTELLAPIGGSFYFVVSNAVLWFYDN